VAPRNLADVRTGLLARRAELLDRASRVDRDLERRNEALATDSADQAIQLQNDEVLTSIGAGAREEIAAIDDALQRLESNLYGTCKQCGKPIPNARLQAVPSATLCTTCNSA
jgi:DnaK suppressor protein